MIFSTVVITLKTYEEFAKEAITYYEKLPQEKSELYKRHYLHIPFELKNYIAQKEEHSNLESAIEKFKQLPVKFDAVIGSDECKINQENETIKIKSVNELDGTELKNKLHNNEDDKYMAFVHAYTKNFIFIEVSEGKTVDLNLLFLNSINSLNFQLFINVGANSKLNLFELYQSDSDSTSSVGAMQELVAGNSSSIEINSIHNENSNTVVLGFTRNRIGSDSTFRFNSFYNGGSHTRIRNRIESSEHKSNVEVNEVVFGSKTQKFDIYTYLVNAAQDTNASLESKAALMNTSYCILKGFAKVIKGANRSRSYVHERGILLDKGAKIVGLPDLSVDENDVKATHSSATAPVDSEAIFYLMSKGIDEPGVRRLLVNAFFTSSLTKIKNNIMKELAMSLVQEKLRTGEFGLMPKLETKDIWVAATDVVEKDIFKGHYKYRDME